MGRQCSAHQCRVVLAVCTAAMYADVLFAVALAVVFAAADSAPGLFCFCRCAWAAAAIPSRWMVFVGAVAVAHQQVCVNSDSQRLNLSRIHTKPSLFSGKRPATKK